MSEKKKKKVVDKVIMGAVIGGAIGSVLGASIAPQDGKKTRADLKEAAGEATGTIKNLWKGVAKLFKVKKKQEKMKKIPTEHTEWIEKS